MSFSHTAFAASALIAMSLLGCEKGKAPPKPTTMEAPGTNAPAAANPASEKK